MLRESSLMCARFTAIILLLAVSSIGAAAAEFYVVQDTATKRCSIAEQKPTAVTAVVVGDGRVYASRTDAEAALKSVQVCKSGDTGAAGPTTEQPK
jgi:hypothetical protein